MLAALRRRLAERDSKGFTLIELIVVVVIVGILTAVAIPSYGAIQANSRFSVSNENLQTTVKLLEAYKIQHGQYPISGGWQLQGYDADAPQRNAYIPKLVPEIANELPMGADAKAQFGYVSDGIDFKLIRYASNGIPKDEWKRVPASMKDSFKGREDRYGYWTPGAYSV